MGVFSSTDRGMFPVRGGWVNKRTGYLGVVQQEGGRDNGGFKVHPSFIFQGRGVVGF
jgi:hypothetical protein